MATYIYWALTSGVAVAVFAIGFKTDKVKLTAMGVTSNEFVGSYLLAN